MENESPIKITEQEAIETIEELWSELFSVKTETDIVNFCTDRNMKRSMEDPNEGTPAKSSQNGSSGNSDPLPLGYNRGTCDECVEIVLKEGHSHKKGRKKIIPRNWGLLLYMKKAGPTEVCNIEDRIGQYLTKTLKPSGIQRTLNCFVCSQQARGSNHNIKDCLQIAEVSLHGDGNLRYTKLMGRPLNICVKGFHIHQTYEEQEKCANSGDGGYLTISEFGMLEKKGATPCPSCGDVFPTHEPEDCPNYPYLQKGDQGFKATYDTWAVAIVECLWAVLDKIEGRGDASDACPSCTESDEHHDRRSCIKRMICKRNPEGEWETQPPGDPQGLRRGYKTSPCENCCVTVLDHSLDNCPHPEFGNYGVRMAIVRGERCVAQVGASRRSYMNGILEIEALCPVCSCFIMREMDGNMTYHDPEACLKNC